MRENTIKITPIEFINLLRLDIDKRPNQHVTAQIVGHISEEIQDSYVERSPVGEKITITASDADGSEKILFAGIVDNISIEAEGGLRTLTAQCISHTIYMDIDRKTRTFQYSGSTCRQVASVLEKDNKRVSILLPDCEKTKIGSMLVQYEETNWEFCKRLASRMGTVVIPNYTLSDPYISIGMTKGAGSRSISPNSYRVCKDVGTYLQNKSYVKSYSERDAMRYQVRSRDIYDLCASIQFEGRQLYVYAIESHLEGSELVHTYELREKGGFAAREYYNTRIIGCSLTGEVKEIDQDMVRVSINKDAKQVRDKWFPYATVYSSPDGTGWYFMPEVGDAIRLHFPTEKEKAAYVISAVHISHGSREDPDTKFIRTKHGKEIVFTPDSILISDGAGSSIKMEKKTGITIKTNKKMRISSSKDLRISTGSKLRIRGTTGLFLEQNDSVISMDGKSLDISAGHVRTQ